MKLFGLKVTNFHNKLECLSFASFSCLVQTHSSLVQKLVNYRQNNFTTLSPGANVIKLFCTKVTNFHNKLECLFLTNFYSLVQKHSSLVQKLVNYRQNNFCNIGSRS